MGLFLSQTGLGVREGSCQLSQQIGTRMEKYILGKAYSDFWRTNHGCFLQIPWTQWVSQILYCFSNPNKMIWAPWSDTGGSPQPYLAFGCPNWLPQQSFLYEGSLTSGPEASRHSAGLSMLACLPTPPQVRPRGQNHHWGHHSLAVSHTE